jgi:outer membrane receptor protein involved in Fe transport
MKSGSAVRRALGRRGAEAFIAGDYRTTSMGRLSHKSFDIRLTAIGRPSTLRANPRTSGSGPAAARRPQEDAMKHESLRSLLALSLAWLLPASFAAAQTATSTLTGVVRDESGGALQGASVTARNVDTGATRTATTDAAGRYALSNLEPGGYELRVELAGFKTAVRTGLALRVGGASVVDATLRIGEVTEELVVEGSEPLIETTRAELSRVVSTQEIESLPNIGRNFVDFVKLASGVAPGRENVGGGPFKEPDTGVGAAAAPRLSFGGQQELNSLVQVDGVDNIQTFTGLPRATPSQEAVKEFRILNSTYLTEYGRALGGFVNIVTKSGGNDFRGSAYYYGMDDALASRSVLNVPEADRLSQHQFGATLGGPLARDRTFFFVNYEGQQRSESNRFSQVILDNIDQINAVRARFNLRPETLDQVRSNDYNQFMLKLDHRASDQVNLSARYSFLDSEAKNFPGGGGRASPASTAARDNQTRDHAAVLNATTLISSRLLNETRVQWARRSYDFAPTVPEPALEVTNLLIMGKTTSDMDFYKEDRFQLGTSFLFTGGGHQFKIGGDYNRIGDQAGWDLFFPARIIFPSMNAFLAFTPVVFWYPNLTGSTHPGSSVPFTEAVPAIWQPQTQFDFDYSALGFFAQDQWSATRKLTLTYGVRYDLESYPDRYVARRDANNVQPRVGLAYAYSSRGVVRAGFGVFSDRLASSIGQVFTTAEWSSRGDLPNAGLLFPGVARVPGRFRQVVVPGPPATPAAITFLTTGRVPATGATSLTDNVGSELTNPYSYQASAQISHEVAKDLEVSVGYLWLEARNLLGHTANLNAVPTGASVNGEPVISGRRFPELGNFHVTDNIGTSTYHGGTIEVQKRFSGGIGFHASYTLSESRTDVDSVTNLGDFPEGLDFGREEALSRQHVRHRGTLSFTSRVSESVPVLGDFKFAALVSLESGRFFTVYTGSDANGDGNPNSDRVGTLGRNTLEGPSYASVDVRVAREFKLGGKARAELSVDVFNLFNRTNVRDLNTVWGSNNPDAAPIASFNTPRDVFNPRQAQIGLRVRF